MFKLKNILHTVGLFCLINVTLIQQGICLTTEQLPTCLNTSSVKGCGLVVTHGTPLTLYKGHNGSLLINASLVGQELVEKYIDLSKCTWTFNIGGLVIVQACRKEHWEDTTLQFVFKTPGLKKVTVTAKFVLEEKQQVLRNCTFVNVTDCSRQFALEVFSKKGSFNVSQNQTGVTLDSPGYVNFTILVFNIIDPFYLCHALHYHWSLGDSQHLRNKGHVSHFYNHSGAFHVVLSIFAGRIFYRNISLTVCVKEKPSPDNNNIAAAVDVSLILGICLATFAVVFCLLLTFRKRRHRLTEVARFDFRHEDLQSSNDNFHQHKQGCFQALLCRRGSNERSLVINEHNSSRRSFGSTLPTEEL